MAGVRAWGGGLQAGLSMIAASVIGCCAELLWLYVCVAPGGVLGMAGMTGGLTPVSVQVQVVLPTPRNSAAVLHRGQQPPFQRESQLQAFQARRPQAHALAEHWITIYQHRPSNVMSALNTSAPTPPG